mgnify:FL=1
MKEQLPLSKKTLADLGGNIAQGIKSFQKKKEDKLKKESALKVIGEYAKMSGSELTEEELKGVYGNLDADTILQQGEILKDLARYEKEENQRVAQQEAMIKAAKRANKLAQARNAIAQRQADTSLLGMQTTAAQNAMGNAIKDKEIDLKTSIYNTENTDKTALSNSLRHVAKQDGGGSLISFLDKYAEEGGKDTTEAIRTYQGAFPGSKRYTANIKTEMENLKQLYL